jgi:hypothetical protein
VSVEACNTGTVDLTITSFEFTLNGVTTDLTMGVSGDQLQITLSECFTDTLEPGTTVDRCSDNEYCADAFARRNRKVMTVLFSSHLALLHLDIDIGCMKLDRTSAEVLKGTVRNKIQEYLERPDISDKKAIAVIELSLGLIGDSLSLRMGAAFRYSIEYKHCYKDLLKLSPKTCCRGHSLNRQQRTYLRDGP